MMGKRSPMTLKSNSTEKYGFVFLLGFCSMLIVLLPLMIMDQGYFIYYGDFVSQQLPFYELANDAARGGQFGWNWYTDLGSSFIGAYSFYLVGSPFFWLSVILPRGWVLYAIPWLLALKHGVAALTAYGYIRRFVKNKNAAVIGGLLYAFSGFQTFNIFFNHFQDVTAFFPLMLIAMEELVNNHRRGWFAASVALMALINYFFFTGQVVFLVLYFFIRCNCRDFHIDLKKLLALAIEAVLGVCIACVILLPAVLAVMQNDRVSQSLFGQDIVFYSDKTRILRIIQSFFMIPDVPARPNLFSANTGKWASIGGYLPLFSMAGVIAFMKAKKKHWATNITWICILCAFVPVLNSAFYMLNGSYYARWFYMPILIMALMTSYALDDTAIDWKPGVKACAVMLTVFGIISCLPKKVEEATVYFEFAEEPWYFYIVLAICVACWIGLYYVTQEREQKKPFLQKAVALTTAACVACTAAVVYYGKDIGTYAEKYINTAIRGEDNISISYETDDADYFRVDMSENYDNYPMFWGLSSMRTFHSTVSTSIMDFYHSIGITRDVASRAETSAYALRGLFSVKYYFDRVDDDDEELDLPGFRYLKTENSFDIYINDYFVPMGFTYDYYVTNEALEGKTNTTKERILMKALVLDETQIEAYKDIITDVQTTQNMNLTKEEYLNLCEAHAKESCTGFTYDANHFAGNITLSQPKLVFFSVPFDNGWTATVNGSPVQIERVSNGFMAVRCESGENAIRFEYETPGLRAGMWLSIGGLLLLIAYLGLSKFLFDGRYRKHSHSYDYTSVVGVRAAKDYTRSLQERILNPEPAAAEEEEAQHGTSE